MALMDINGLKFPDEYVVKFFFKEGLDITKGKMLELGCANGNNARLFFEFGWDVVGVDFDPNAVTSANNFFNKLASSENLKNTFKFVESDMVNFVQHESDSFDVIILPNSLCYLTNEQIDRFLKSLYENNLLKKDAKLFIRTRLLSDYRYARGEMIGINSFRLEEEETGEKGSINTFFSESSLVLKLKEHLSFDSYVTLNIIFENLQNGKLISNADTVFWTTIKEKHT